MVKLGESGHKIIKRRNLMEGAELSDSPYKEIIGDYFDHTFDFEFLDVVADIIGRVDDFTDEDDIASALDDGLIYDADCWKILQYYCDPFSADWQTAYESFYSDIITLCDQIANSQGEESEEEF